VKLWSSEEASHTQVTHTHTHIQVTHTHTSYTHTHTHRHTHACTHTLGSPSKGIGNSVAAVGTLSSCQHIYNSKTSQGVMAESFKHFGLFYFDGFESCLKTRTLRSFGPCGRNSNAFCPAFFSLIFWLL
jgi:hypothetical protein